MGPQKDVYRLQTQIAHKLVVFLHYDISLRWFQSKNYTVLGLRNLLNNRQGIAL